MQGQNLLAGLRALVEQIDGMERKIDRHSERSSDAKLHMRAPQATLLAIEQTATPSNMGIATSIVQRLGIQSNDFSRVAHAVGRSVRYTH